jgi:hypothetical protein
MIQFIVLRAVLTRIVLNMGKPGTLVLPYPLLPLSPPSRKLNIEFFVAALLAQHGNIVLNTLRNAPRAWMICGGNQVSNYLLFRFIY